MSAKLIVVDLFGNVLNEWQAMWPDEYHTSGPKITSFFWQFVHNFNKKCNERKKLRKSPKLRLIAKRIINS